MVSLQIRRLILVGVCQMGSVCEPTDSEVCRQVHDMLDEKVHRARDSEESGKQQRLSRPSIVADQVWVDYYEFQRLYRHGKHGMTTRQRETEQRVSIAHQRVFGLDVVDENEAWRQDGVQEHNRSVRHYLGWVDHRAQHFVRLSTLAKDHDEVEHDKHVVKPVGGGALGELTHNYSGLRFGTESAHCHRWRRGLQRLPQ
ncbi:hypothetical protein H257_12464 [Aphanomyces astaci]|uniref:Secreted protein n=1 Tax=Aphanomyces astaci TaxID=112090 RepID=W4FZU1_APHAT|nr:hypothetical protein H257_12464 [Aphanomyces astaci]ETV72294.1 hypothetical protein H257_12464 [Aphanomyces astaci]|eukprot:XP_009837976.1 hypothetical protein H257_12464 [Aphanomyces astaci]